MSGINFGPFVAYLDTYKVVQNYLNGSEDLWRGREWGGSLGTFFGTLMFQFNHLHHTLNTALTRPEIIF